MLYQLSYFRSLRLLRRAAMIRLPPSLVPRVRIELTTPAFSRDLLLGKEMLYQLSYFRSLRLLRRAAMIRLPPSLVPRVRIELTTPAFSVLCSTN